MADYSQSKDSVDTLRLKFWQKSSFWWLWALLVSFELFLRKPQALLLPQFWAEDGKIFFDQAYHHGLLSLFEPYAGYYHLYPRIVAYLVTHIFPYSIAPLLFNLANLACFWILTRLLFSNRIKLDYKAALALVVPIACTTTEVVFNLTNSQWILAIVFILIIISETPQSLYKKSLEAGLLLILVFTGPFALPFSSLLFIRALIRKKYYDWLLFAFSIVGVFAVSRALGNGMAATSSDNSYFQYIRSFGSFIGYTIAGSRGADDLDIPLASWLLSILGIGFYAIVIPFLVVKKDWKILTILVGGSLVYLSVWFKFQTNPQSFYGSSRYTFVPTISIIWTLLLIAKYTRGLSAVMVACIVLHYAIFSGNFRAQDFEDFKWAKRARCIGKKAVCSIPINPPGWKMKIYRR